MLLFFCLLAGWLESWRFIHVCACVCVCARARARVCVCVCVCVRRMPDEHKWRRELKLLLPSVQVCLCLLVRTRSLAHVPIHVQSSLIPTPRYSLFRSRPGCGSSHEAVQIVLRSKSLSHWPSPPPNPRLAAMTLAQAISLVHLGPTCSAYCIAVCSTCLSIQELNKKSQAMTTSLVPSCSN